MKIQRRITSKALPLKFYRPSFFHVLVFLSSLWIISPASGFTPIELRSGRLIGAEMTVDEVEKLNLSELLLAGRLEPEPVAAGDGRLRPPDAGKAYLILEIILEDGKSIGKYDYTVQFREHDRVYRCIAMARGESVFDPRMWEVTADDPDFAPVRLLYETDQVEGEVEVLLVPALGLSITQETKSLTIDGASLD